VYSVSYSIRLNCLDKNEKLSIRKQSNLIGISRSRTYYKKRKDSELNIKTMHKIDKLITSKPFLGSRKIADMISLDFNIDINRKRIQRLMNKMGLEAIYPKKKTTFANKNNEIFPYLLKNLDINKPNQVWSTDITYLPMKGGYMYLVAIIDWYSRKILSWELSHQMNTSFCLDALDNAIKATGTTPKIFNTDQGSQFTSSAWLTKLKALDIKISMDGKGRWIDNVIIERFWRSIKYDDIYINLYETPKELEVGILEYIKFYNSERPHASLGKKTTPNMKYQKYIAPIKVKQKSA
jgi:putative transposase